MLYCRLFLLAEGFTIGFVTPFCTYSTIPILVIMRRRAVPHTGHLVDQVVVARRPTAGWPPFPLY